MSRQVWFDDVLRVVPNFDLARCHWLRRLDTWEVCGELCCRLVLEYDNRLDISFIALGIREMPGKLNYMPYDLGEFLVSVDPATGRTIIFDELKGWRMVADSLSFERAVPLERPNADSV